MKRIDEFCTRYFWPLLIVAYAIIVFVLIAAGRAHAQDNRGVSWIGQMCSASADCGAILDSYRSAPVVVAGYLNSTFNPNGCKCIGQVMSILKPKTIRVTLTNSTCFPERGRRCQKHECFYGESVKSADAKVRKKDPKILGCLTKSATQVINHIGLSNTPVKLFVSPCLECDLSDAARKIMLEYVRPMFTGATLVDNPHGSRCLPGYACEVHGAKNAGRGQLVDLDGEDYDSIDSRGFGNNNTDAEMALAWKLCNNGLKKGEGFSPPQDRRNFCGSSRDGRDFSAWTAGGALSVSSPVNPADRQGCKRYLKAPDGAKKGFIWKLGDGRAYAVLLLPRELGRPKAVTVHKDGRIVDTARFRALYEHDPRGQQRAVYDLRLHTASFPDNSVLHAGDACFILEKPQFRID